MTNKESLIGSIVDVIIDRPLGYKDENFFDPYHEVNAGYVENIYDEKGRPQNVYVIGVDVPIKKYSGKVIAVVNGTNHTSWVVAPLTKEYTKQEIARKILFAEKYGPYQIRMN